MVVTIGERAGGDGGVQDAPRGLRSTAKRVVAGSPAVHERDTLERLAETAFKPVGPFAAVVWEAAGCPVMTANARAETSAESIFMLYSTLDTRNAEPIELGRRPKTAILKLI